MRQTYLRYYEQPRSTAIFAFLWDALRARSRIRKLGLLNRQRDYLRIMEQPKLFALHRKLNQYLAEAAGAWGSYDYGEGYFYQSCPPIEVTGLRDSQKRVDAMGLANLLKDKSVLEIGCNSGFLALSFAHLAKYVVGFDLNPHLIQMARTVTEYLKCPNVEFDVASFETFTAKGPFDVVLSFANHSTYDGNTRQSVESYFDRCRDFTKPGGLLLFESHPPKHEGAGLHGVCQFIGERFSIQEQRVLGYGTFLDRGRTFIVAARCGNSAR